MKLQSFYIQDQDSYNYLIYLNLNQIFVFECANICYLAINNTFIIMNTFLNILSFQINWLKTFPLYDELKHFLYMMN